MDYVKKFSRWPFAALYAMVSGVFNLLILLISFKIQSATNFDDLGFIGLIAPFFWLGLICAILALASHIFRMTQGEKNTLTYVLTGVLGLQVLLALMSIPVINAIAGVSRALSSSSLGGLLGYGYSLSKMEDQAGLISIMVLLSLVAAGISAWVFFSKKMGTQLKAAAPEVKEAAAAAAAAAGTAAAAAGGAAKKAAAVASEAAGDVATTVQTEAPKMKNPFASTKAKIIAAVVVAVCVIGGGAWYFIANRATDYDPMTNISVKFDGTSGIARAYIDGSKTAYPDGAKSKQKSFIDSIYLTLDKDNKLSNGDTVTVTAQFDEEAAKKAKINVVNASKSFTVEGLREVYKSAADIPSEIKDYADKIITEWATKEKLLDVYGISEGEKYYPFGEAPSISEPKLIGKFFVEPKQGNYASHESGKIVYLYQIQATGKESSWFSSSKDAKDLTINYYPTVTFNEVSTDYKSVNTADVSRVYMSKRDASADLAIKGLKSDYSSYKVDDLS